MSDIVQNFYETFKFFSGFKKKKPRGMSLSGNESGKEENV